MPFTTPVIRQVLGSALDHANSNVSQLLSAPAREALFPVVFSLFDLGPVCKFRTEYRICAQIYPPR